jgi:hypothetical protein
VKQLPSKRIDLFLMLSIRLEFTEAGLDRLFQPRQQLRERRLSVRIVVIDRSKKSEGTQPMTFQTRSHQLFHFTGLVLLCLWMIYPLSAAADHRPASKPVAITDQDLQRLSPAARKELLELIEFKRQNPDPRPGEFRFKENGIVEGNVGPGGVNIKLLGGAIQIGGKKKARPQPKRVANYHPPGVPVYPEDLVITMVKRGNDPLLITLQRGSFSISMTGEQIEDMIDKYKPYVVQMLRQALEQSGEPAGAPPEGPPATDLGAPESDLGEPSAIPESDLGKPSELPGPDLGKPAPPKPGKDESLKEKEAPKEK